MDHRSLLYAFRRKLEKAQPKRICQLNFVRQFTTNTRYIPGKGSAVAEFSSQIQSIEQITDYQNIACAQQFEEELQKLQSEKGTNYSINFKSFLIPRLR